MQHCVGANKALPFVGAAAAGRQPRRQPLDHAADHRVLLRVVLGWRGVVRGRLGAVAGQRREPRLQRRRPWRLRRRVAEQSAIDGDRLLQVAVLFGGEAEIEARRRQSGLLGERLVEGGARVGGDDSARRADQRLAVIGASGRVLAVEPQRLLIGLDRVVETSETHVDRRDQRPGRTVVGIGGEALLDMGERRFDPRHAAHVDLALGERRVGEIGPTQIGVERQGDDWRRDDDRDRRTQRRSPGASATAPSAVAALAAISRRAASTRAPAASSAGRKPRATSRSISPSCAL